MVYVKVDDVITSSSINFIITEEHIDKTISEWSNNNEILNEIQKINYCKNITSWDDIDQDLFRLILLYSIINNKEELTKLILRHLIVSIQKLLKSEIISVKIFRYEQNDIVIDYNISTSTAKDAFIRKKKGQDRAKLMLVVDNTNNDNT